MNRNQLKILTVVLSAILLGLVLWCASLLETGGWEQPERVPRESTAGTTGETSGASKLPQSMIPTTDPVETQPATQLPEATQPITEPETAAPTTKPAETTPPATEPQETVPPATQPPATTPPTTEPTETTVPNNGLGENELPPVPI